ncbi:hypothetical protein QUA40_27590, partial [Microcoleus sp. Pol11C3]|uniref:hypothetical protein n=1 Tax=Microcoleus sp. Pol11C3 TaxID=3055390 RepID=UPI002FD6BEA4
SYISKYLELVYSLLLLYLTFVRNAIAVTRSKYRNFLWVKIIYARSICASLEIYLQRGDLC